MDDCLTKCNNCSLFNIYMDSTDQFEKDFMERYAEESAKRLFSTDRAPGGMDPTKDPLLSRCIEQFHADFHRGILWLDRGDDKTRYVEKPPNSYTWEMARARILAPSVRPALANVMAMDGDGEFFAVDARGFLFFKDRVVEPEDGQLKSFEGRAVNMSCQVIDLSFGKNDPPSYRTYGRGAFNSIGSVTYLDDIRNMTIHDPKEELTLPYPSWAVNPAGKAPLLRRGDKLFFRPHYELLSVGGVHVRAARITA